MIAADALHPTQAFRGLAAKVQPTLNLGLIPGNSDPVGFWLSPQDLLDFIESKFGRIDFDPFPFPRPAGWDALKESWGKPGDLCYVNQPFVGPSRSRTKCHRQIVRMARQDRRVVSINTFDRWLVDFVRIGGKFHIPPDFDWISPEGKTAAAGRPHLLMEYPTDRSLLALSEIAPVAIEAGGGRDV